MRIRSKICGITSIEDARLVAANGADALGLVFYAPSPRDVSLEVAAQITADIPAFVTTTALFVNPEVDFVNQVIADCKVDLLQFHGDESPKFCGQFNRPYIKAIRMQESTDLVQLSQDYTGAQCLLLDTYKKGVPGGTGESFNWQWLEGRDINTIKPIILAGGLTPDNIQQAIAQVKPWAVDVSGGVEARPGKKSPEKVIQFIQKVNDSI